MIIYTNDYGKKYVEHLEKTAPDSWQIIGYFFDTGVTNALAHTLSDHLNPHISGRRFEQFVICQIIAFIHYKRLDYQLYYWRTNHGAEVDLLICRGNNILYAIEIKSSQNIAKESLSGLNSFINDNPNPNPK